MVPVTTRFHWILLGRNIDRGDVAPDFSDGKYMDVALETKGMAKTTWKSTGKVNGFSDLQNADPSLGVTFWWARPISPQCLCPTKLPSMASQKKRLVVVQTMQPAKHQQEMHVFFPTKDHWSRPKAQQNLNHASWQPGCYFRGHFCQGNCDTNKSLQPVMAPHDVNFIWWVAVWWCNNDVPTWLDITNYDGKNDVIMMFFLDIPYTPWVWVILNVVNGSWLTHRSRSKSPYIHMCSKIGLRLISGTSFAILDIDIFRWENHGKCMGNKRQVPTLLELWGTQSHAMHWWPPCRTNQSATRHLFSMRWLLRHVAPSNTSLIEFPSSSRGKGHLFQICSKLRWQIETTTTSWPSVLFSLWRFRHRSSPNCWATAYFRSGARKRSSPQAGPHADVEPGRWLSHPWKIAFGKLT